MRRTPRRNPLALAVGAVALACTALTAASGVASAAPGAGPAQAQGPDASPRKVTSGHTDCTAKGGLVAVQVSWRSAPRGYAVLHMDGDAGPQDLLVNGESGNATLTTWSARGTWTFGDPAGGTFDAVGYCV